MEKTWVVVSNSSRARIFAVETRELLKELDSLVHSESRLLEVDLKSDRQGRAFDSFGMGRHAMEKAVSPHKTQAMEFARQISEHLQKALAEGEFRRLYLAAGPQFLGMLRQTLTPQIEAVLAGEINKDMTLLTPDEIREHLPYIP